ncbi:hypothetical protein GQ43DRAFT_440816 [Delitschia confertaspora ATCC 74209]|uniref:Chitin synthesis regulation, resistance to congo red-domain-containing protein n=1 Tax=Delitschia confertaspora ATCC 74209 TaxID=1513339 RepID=A0A9P4JQ44_9PLEO|nr:hypothetical protein GQ43DRAFT_440816 [Delitschia confertaspora ATCC 74209]
MAPTGPLEKRDYWCEDQFGRVYRCRSAWHDWVRWVVVVVVVVGFFLLFVVCSCITARRRRKLGRQPLYGTGWAARPGAYNHNNGNPQNAQPYYHNQPAPPYTPQPQAGQHSYYGNNQGYYAGQQQGVELQSPPQAYTRGEDVYQPPPGPPPAKV